MEKYLTKQDAEEIGEIFSANVEGLKNTLPTQIADLWFQVTPDSREQAIQNLIEQEMAKIDSTVRVEINRMATEDKHV
jgi:hypothetical protein